MNANSKLHASTTSQRKPQNVATFAQVLRMCDGLACGDRIWLRGWLLNQDDASTNSIGKSRWWSWRTSTGPYQADLETRFSSQVIHCKADVSADGYFSVHLHQALPTARRGWRVARTCLSSDGFSAEGCCVVLETSKKWASALVVILPRQFTCGTNTQSALDDLIPAERVGRLLQRMYRAGGIGRPVFYVGIMPDTDAGRERETALALTALGWPAGTVVLLPADQKNTNHVLSNVIDELRWLLAGSLTLDIVNLEPGFEASLAVENLPREDRATIHSCLGIESLFATDPEKGNGQIARVPAVLRPTRASRIPRHPIVFCHGMLALSLIKMQLPANFNCFIPLEPFLKDRGIRAWFPQVAPTSGVAERAQQLKEQIIRWTDGPVNLIAHSMGGLDARYMITHLGMADRVRSLTTICTPHQGTYLADWFIANYRNRVPLLLGMQVLGINVDGFRDCTPDACRRFNEETPNHANVAYHSYGGDVPHWRVYPFLRRAWTILTPVEGPNDGMVSVASARWGEYLGTIHADHFAQTPDGMLVTKTETFDSLGFYLDLVEELAWRGY